MNEPEPLPSELSCLRPSVHHRRHHRLLRSGRPHPWMVSVVPASLWRAGRCRRSCEAPGIVRGPSWELHALVALREWNVVFGVGEFALFFTVADRSVALVVLALASSEAGVVVQLARRELLIAVEAPSYLGGPRLLTLLFARLGVAYVRAGRRGLGFLRRQDRVARLHLLELEPGERLGPC